MLKFKPCITIWQIDLIRDNSYYFRREYFLTKRAVDRFLKKHEKEINQSNVTWDYQELKVWLW